MTLVAGSAIQFTGTFKPGFLVAFPLANQNPCTVTVNAVFDHAQKAPYKNDSVVMAYTGEKGSCDSNNPVQDFQSVVGTKTPHSGYRNATGAPFLVNGVYAGGGGNSSTKTCKGKSSINLPSNTFLFYDGHPGYDYHAPCGTPVYAATSGTVSYPSSIPGLVSGIAPSFHVLELDPDTPNGNYKLYYLHLSTYPPSKYPSCMSSPPVIPPSCNGQPCHVTAGQLIGRSGDAGVSGSPHLHFEVQMNGVPVDPYGWKGIAESDPYNKANINLWY